MSKDMDLLRAAITDNDRAIVAAVNERLRLVARLWQLKRDLGVDRFDPGRERSLRAELAATNAGPLSAQELDHLIDELLAVTKRALQGDSA